MSESKRTVPAEVLGVSIARRLIFEGAVTDSNWQGHMLYAVAVAQRLGLTRFELEVKGEPRIDTPSDDERKISQSLLSFLSPAPAEEWKGETPELPKAPAVVVRVFAVVVE